MQSRVEVGTQVTLSPVFRRVNIRAEMVAAKGCGKLPWSGWLRWLVQCRCNAQLPPPSPGRTDVSKCHHHQPLLPNSRETTFPTKFFARGTLLPSFTSFEEHRWKNWTIFWNFETHFGESLNFDSEGKIFSPMQFWIFPNILLPSARNILRAMITDSQSWELR